MKLYRIYTEDKNAIPSKLANYYLEGFTVYLGLGVWKGKQEDSCIIEVLDNFDSGPIESKVLALAKRIKKVNEQKAVYITCQSVELEII